MARFVWFSVALGALGALETNLANAAWGLRFDVSRNGGTTWHSSVDALPGDVIAFRFGAYFDSTTRLTTASGTGMPQALCRFCGQNQVVGLQASDAIANIVLRTSNFNANVLKITGNLIGTSATSSFASNLYLHGLPPSPTLYDAIYTGEIRLSSIASVRTLMLNNRQFGSGAVPGLTFFNGGALPKQEIAAPTDYSQHLDIQAAINVVPAPGAWLLAVGATALGLPRRRRVAP